MIWEKVSWKLIAEMWAEKLVGSLKTAWSGVFRVVSKHVRGIRKGCRPIWDPLLFAAPYRGSSALEKHLDVILFPEEAPPIQDGWNIGNFWTTAMGRILHFQFSLNIEIDCTKRLKYKSIKHLHVVPQRPNFQATSSTQAALSQHNVPCQMVLATWVCAHKALSFTPTLQME